MERKPWPLVVLAALHFFEPPLKLALYSWLWNIPLSNVLSATANSLHTWRSCVFLFGFPVAGVALFAVKRWSFPVFLGVQAITLAQVIYDSFFGSNPTPVLLVALFLCINLCVTSYFLLPAVRIAYLDPSIRWWESLPRYQVSWPIQLKQDMRVFLGQVENISEGGVFCELNEKAPLDATQPVNATIQFPNSVFETRGHFRHSRFTAKKSYFGVEFEKLPRAQKRVLRTALRELEVRGAPRKPPRESSVKSFKRWLIKLLTTGKGLIP